MNGAAWSGRKQQSRWPKPTTVTMTTISEYLESTSILIEVWKNPTSERLQRRSR
jgi:hypothetical protein